MTPVKEQPGTVIQTEQEHTHFIEHVQGRSTHGTQSRPEQEHKQVLKLGHIQRKSISGARAEHIQHRSKPGGEAQGCTIEQEHTRAGARMEQKHFLSTTNTKSTSAGSKHTEQNNRNKDKSRAGATWT